MTFRRQFGLRERLQMMVRPYEYVQQEREAVVEHIIEQATGNEVKADLWCASIGGVTIITDEDARYTITAEPESESK